METVFITLGNKFVARNIFSTKFWPIFIQRWGGKVKIVLLVPNREADFYKKHFTSPQIILEPVEPRFRSRFAGMVTSLARSAVKNHTNLWSKMRSYERGESSFAVTLFKRVHTLILGGMNWYKRLLRFLILRIRPAAKLADLYEKYQPRLLIETSVTDFDFDVPVAAEARRRGLRIIGITRSWDNFTSHGMLRVVPDKILVQNEFLREMAVKYQAISSKLIEVVGIPHYDWYKELDRWLEPRERFFAKTGLDPQKKLILYGAMGDFLFPAEVGVADVFEKLIESGKVQEAQVLFRAHPKFTSPLERMEVMRHVIPDRMASRRGDLISREEISHLINSLYHCDILVTGASTLAIDGVAFGKPVVCVGFDPASELPARYGVGQGSKPSYWHSVRRFYDTYTHFEEFMKTGAARLARAPEELAEHVNAYFKNPRLDEEGRKRAVERFIAPFDGKSSERLEESISDHVQAAD